MKPLEEKNIILKDSELTRRERVELVRVVYGDIGNCNFSEESLARINKFINESTPDNPDSDYLNDYHREWNERCLKANEEVASMHLSHEEQREYCRRLTERVENQLRREREERRLERERKKSLKLTQEQRSDGTRK